MSVRAMNWAMEQATGDPRAQCLLFVLADCANPEGVAWPSVKYMAEKSQQSKATVQRRLKELEEIGAIARFPRWEDDTGKINAAGRGRRTSDEIRLLLDRRIASPVDDSDSDDESSKPETALGNRGEFGAMDYPTPPSQAETGGSQADTPPSLGSDPPPSHCCDPYMNRNSEPQKDSPPNPPPGGEASNVVEVEGWQAFETAFAADGDPIVRVSIAKQLFAALTADEKRRLVAAAKGLIAWRRRQKRPPGKPSAQTFIRETDAWANWQKYAPPDPVVREPPVFIADGSADWRALCVLARICDDPEPVARMVADHGLGLLRSKPLSEAMRALGQAFDLESGEWPIVEDGSQQCGAWCAFVGIKPFNLFTGEVVQKEIMPGKTVAWKVAKFGLRVPWLWPPRKDGSLSLAASAMPVANHEMSDQGE